ncbi:MAG: hypothetical protein OXH09_08395, partial [Gammaproteobacteria bacterium]|nr:hypothetical protein [Gammaproteobacteria bacterium]
EGGAGGPEAARPSAEGDDRSNRTETSGTATETSGFGERKAEASFAGDVACRGRGGARGLDSQE